MEDYGSHKHWFLADRTNGRAYAALLRPSAWRQSVVYLSVVCNVCIVAKRCVLDQKLLLTAQSHIGRMCGIDWYQNERPWTLFRSCLRSTASHSSLNMAKNVRDRGLVPKDYQYRKWPVPSRMVMWPTDNVAWSQNVKLLTAILLEPNISDGLFSTPLPCLTARSWEPVRISGWNLRGKNYAENRVTLTSAIFDWSTRVTDRQTDR